MNLNQCDFELMNSCLRVAVRKKLISANDLAIPIVRFCTTPLYRYTCTLYMCTYGLTRHYYIVLCLVHTVYDALLLNYAFPFLISFVFSEKKIHFRNSIRSHGAAKPPRLLRDSLSGSQSSYKLSA